MDKLLVINAHSNGDSTSSFSLQIYNHFLKLYKELKNPIEKIEIINLYNEDVPFIGPTVLSAWKKLAEGERITDEERRITQRMTKILHQFKSANKYVLVIPLHNFNIPSKLKDYMDNILIVQETFKYTENGPVGLLKDGRSLLVIQASGSIYTNNDWYTEVEYSHKYLKSMFNLMGIEDYQIIRVQGTALLNREDILEKAYKEAEKAAVRLSVEKLEND
ncbi:NAD(P)H-dependent oxidoreductase [Neobacillus sp. MM2021_6]|uniref:FMN-dependent NADH-azoreductase n=1 Tax=Bacillaceae TaxID=186817 RepID=UPI001407EF28|nr:MULTISPECIES: NAD(P)H-dependent oxidoreductase [Bacillaceae]MBO0962626.1 NAD(P)H-dependent oxidoreductase [Neobacillus sp. MM2021_6]NHC21199.1 FMN-dependent NADH-azoreductase [Bacillus sp. MM2020_4]